LSTMRILSGLAITIVLGARSMPAADLDRLVPVRWPGGPLEVARRAALKPVSPELAAALRNWYQPRSLDRLRHTPLNCILVTWSGGDAAMEREQQRILRDYSCEAHRRDITVMALVTSSPTARGVADAVAAGLDGFVVDGEAASADQVAPATRPLAPDRGRELPVIRLSSKAATVPGIRLFSEDGAVQATPTSEPWIDSNLWFVRFLRWVSSQPAWLGYSLGTTSDHEYARAIADAAAAGGRWVVAPDDTLISGLFEGTPAAERSWRRIVDTLRFFEDHSGWRQFSPAGTLGIVPQNTDSGAENLNLIARRKIPYKLLTRATLSGPGLHRLNAVLALGCVLNESEKAALRDFVESGGLAIVGPAWGRSVPPGEDFDVRPVGAGRVAVYRNDEADSETLSKDVLHWIGRENLGVRLFHAPTVLPTVSESSDGMQLLVQMVNYATEPAEAVMVRLAGEYQSARVYGLDGPPVALELEKSERGIEVKVPAVPVYAALLLER